MENGLEICAWLLGFQSQYITKYNFLCHNPAILCSNPYILNFARKKLDCFTANLRSSV